MNASISKYDVNMSITINDAVHFLLSTFFTKTYILENAETGNFLKFILPPLILSFQYQNLKLKNLIHFCYISSN